MNFVESLNLFGVPAKEIPCIKGSGAPSSTTAGAVGLFYMNTDNGDVYKCTYAAAGVCAWEPLGTNTGGNVDLTGVVKSVNGQTPDENGNVEITASGSTAAAIDYDQNVKAINHRGYSTAPENTIPAYILSKQMGFTYVEADVSFTSDGVAVLLHDGTIDRTSNGSGNISSMTYADVSKYDFGSWKASKYAGTRIPTFEEFIILCKRIGLHPYIELKQGDEAKIQALVETVKNCGMDGKATWISFVPSYLEYVKAVDASARLGYLVFNVAAADITTAQGLQTNTNEVFINSHSYSADEISLCRAAGLPLEIWTINFSSEIKNMDAYISGVTSDNLIAGKILHDMGMVYEYGIDVPEKPATSITLSATSISFTSADSQKITATVEPSDTTDKVVWSTSAPNVATVVGGIVTPVGNGSAIITAAAGSVSAECSVTVDVELPAQYIITNNLTNAVNSNSATVVHEGSFYTAYINAMHSYVLESVVVTMGGVDVTADVYADGVVTIPAVTGDIVITATAGAAVDTRTMLYNWDFTNSLVDTVNGTQATLIGKATQDANGLAITDGSSGARFGAIAKKGMTFEVDIAEGSTLTNTGVNNRLLIFNSADNGGAGVVWWGGGNYWSTYLGAWGSGYSPNPALFSGKTMTVVINDDGTVEVYSGGEIFVITSTTVNFDSNGYVTLGSTATAAAGMVITAMRIYDGAHPIPQNAPDLWVDDTVVLDASRFGYFKLGDSYTAASGRYGAAANYRLSYDGAGIPLNPGYEYTVTVQSVNGLIKNIGVKQYDSREKCMYKSAVTSKDSGWVSDGYTFTQTAENYDGMWITLGLENANENIPDGELISVTITRRKV